MFQLGVYMAFTTNADFNDISENLAIGNIIQKTSIDVSEVGTEATSATSGKEKN